MGNDLFSGLNEPQKQAVENTNGASLVIAGAGSGKTRVLTYRIAHLLEKGVSPSAILALTFTNKAAKEMKERIDRVLGNDISRFLWMGTFHSMFGRILRREASVMGYSSNFTIYDTQDSKNLIRSIVSEMELNDKYYKPGDVFGRISSAKNNLITPQSYASNPKAIEVDKANKRPLLYEIYQKYVARCKKSDAMDFDDLLLNTNILFRDSPDILRQYQEKFDYILVDEYQDTNFSQYLIVKKLGDTHKNVCVVGDDSQSIYSFRGALIENILNFKKDYPDCQTYKLEQNYRSTQTIVNAANSIIDKNKEQLKKTVYSKKEIGEKIDVIQNRTDNEEGFWVSNAILDTTLSKHYQYSDFAILYRTHSQSRIFEEALRKRNIPYKVYGSISFYQRKEIKDMLAYLRLLVNPKDDEALKRVINYPARGLGKTTLNKIEIASIDFNVSMWDVVLNPLQYEVNINKGTQAKLNAFAELIEVHQKKTAEMDAYQVAYELASASGVLKELYSGTTPEERSKYENLEELLNGIKEFAENLLEEEGETASLERYLENVSLLTDQDNEKEEDINKVSIMTIHAAKGLEFKQVFIAGAEEELFPSFMAYQSLKDLEEERRLFYVALTRAMDKATITYSQSRYRWGNLTDCNPSRFISEIDEQYLDWDDDPRKATAEPEDVLNANTIIRSKDDVIKVGKTKSVFGTAPKPNKPTTKVFDPNFTPDDPEKIIAGMQVEHQRFGKGKIVHIEGESPNRKATVFFQDTKQEKQLLLKFAKLRIVKSAY